MDCGGGKAYLQPDRSFSCLSSGRGLVFRCAVIQNFIKRVMQCSRGVISLGESKAMSRNLSLERHETRAGPMAVTRIKTKQERVIEAPPKGQACQDIRQDKRIKIPPRRPNP